MKKVKCIPEFYIFTVFLKNRNIIFKMKISNAALTVPSLAVPILAATFVMGLITFPNSFDPFQD